MYSNPIAVSNGTSTINFDYRGSQLDQSSYKDGSASLDQAHNLTVKHQTTNKGKDSQTRRSLFRIDKTVENEQGVQGELSVYLVVSIPEKVATSTQVTEQVTLMKNFLAATGHIAKIVAADL